MPKEVQVGDPATGFVSHPWSRGVVNFEERVGTKEIVLRCLRSERERLANRV